MHQFITALCCNKHFLHSCFAAAALKPRDLLHLGFAAEKKKKMSKPSYYIEEEALRPVLSYLTRQMPRTDFFDGGDVAPPPPPSSPSSFPSKFRHHQTS